MTYYCAIIHNTDMSEYEKKHVERELTAFALRNFVQPSECRNPDQIRFYIQELCIKIEEYKKRFDYVPRNAYTLLSEYNSRQNTMLYHDFIKSY